MTIIVQHSNNIQDRGFAILFRFYVPWYKNPKAIFFLYTIGVASIIVQHLYIIALHTASIVNLSVPSKVEFPSKNQRQLLNHNKSKWNANSIMFIQNKQDSNTR